jgi:hypothetical protein
MKKTKKVVKSKEAVIEELRQNAAFMDKMKFVKERFFPALAEASTSIEDAQQLLSGFNTAIMQEFLAEMKNKKTSELNLQEKLDKTNENYEKHKELIALFDDMSVFDCKDYIEGMRAEIGVFIKDEMESRKLDSLKTKWIDEK